MKTGIKDFCKDYIEMLKNNETIKEWRKKFDKEGVYMSYAKSSRLDYVDRITFELHSMKYAPGYMTLGGRGNRKLFTLDEDDVEYLYAKYHKQLEIELTANIEELKQNYKI
jgi:hypothetical protein